MSADEDWTRVFHKELARRRTWYVSKPEIFKKVYSANPKGLRREESCKEDHVWVPASHLHIHDSSTSRLVLNQVKTRAFTEAKPYMDDGVTIVPQMCWHCDATREYELDMLTTEEREAILKANRPKAQRGKKSSHIESSFDDLFQFEVA